MDIEALYGKGGPIELEFLLLRLDKMIQFYATTTSEQGRDFVKLLNDQRVLGRKLKKAMSKL